MALTINHFRNLRLPVEISEHSPASLASLKVDKSKTGGEEKIKLFGMGKGHRGEAMRMNDGIFNKIYSFFHDPSGKENRALRREFVRVFNETYQGVGIDIGKHIDANSRKPLNAGQVIQLVASADLRKAALEKADNVKSYEGVDVSHGNFSDNESLERAFKGFADKGGLGTGGSKTVDVMATVDRRGMKEVQRDEREILNGDDDGINGERGGIVQDNGGEGAINLRVKKIAPEKVVNKVVNNEGGQQPRVKLPGDPNKAAEMIHDAFPVMIMTIEMKDGRKDTRDLYEDLQMLCGSHWKMPIVENQGDREADHVRISIGKLLDLIPTQVENALAASRSIEGIVTLFSKCHRPDDLPDLAVATEKLMKAVQSGDKKAVREMGEEILELTRKMQTAVDEFLAVMEHPDCRKIFERTAAGGDRLSQLETMDHYNKLVAGAQMMAKTMRAEGSGFQSLIALGAVASGNPDLAMERLGERLPKDDLPVMVIEERVLDLGEVQDLSMSEKRLDDNEIDFETDTPIETEVPTGSPSENFVELSEHKLDSETIETLNN